jgi:N-acetylmuramoyl-L-alanine amidase
MYSKNIAAAFFSVLIILFIGYILYLGSIKPISVVIQAGHEGRVSGNTGAESLFYKEENWNIIVANEVAQKLTSWNIDVKRVPAKVSFMRAKIAVSIHFDGAKRTCNSGASIGYPSSNSYAFAKYWKSLYGDYFPFKWHEDNFTENLKEYYAYRYIRADKFLILELGEITCDKQTKWLYPRLKKIAHLIAYAIATELGHEVEKPHL